MPDYNLVRGAIKLQGLVDAASASSIPELIRQLPNYLTIEVPSTISNVVVSPQQPGEDQRNSLWVRLSNAGGFIGLYVYAIGQWRQAPAPVPQQLFRIADASADSRTPPEGFTLATEANFLTTSQKNFIKSQWHWHNDEVDTYYDVFDVFFTGY